MSDNTLPQPSADRFDPLLTIILAAANQGTLSTPITVLVDGILISGTLISMRDYFIRQQDRLAAEGTFGTVWFDGVIKPVIDSMTEDPSSASDDQESFDGPVHGFYLADVTFSSTAGIIHEIPFWSGKFSAISGWWWGSV
jgi:hypothetical protein